MGRSSSDGRSPGGVCRFRKPWHLAHTWEARVRAASEPLGARRRYRRQGSHLGYEGSCRSHTVLGRAQDSPKDQTHRGSLMARVQGQVGKPQEELLVEDVDWYLSGGLDAPYVANRQLVDGPPGPNRQFDLPPEVSFSGRVISNDSAPSAQLPRVCQSSRSGSPRVLSLRSLPITSQPWQLSR